MILHDLLKKACLGDSDAQYQLGVTYCIKADVVSAIYWLASSKQRGNKKAKILLKQVIQLYREYLKKAS